MLRSAAYAFGNHPPVASDGPLPLRRGRQCFQRHILRSYALQLDDDFLAVEPHGHQYEEGDVAEGVHQRSVLVVAEDAHAAVLVEPAERRDVAAVGGCPVDHAAENLDREARHHEGEERVHAHRLERDEVFLLALDVDEPDEEGQAEDGPATGVEHVGTGPQRLADRKPDAPDAADRQADGSRRIKLGNGFRLVLRVPDHLADEIAQQDCAGAGKRAEQALRVEGDAVAVIDVVLAEQRDVDLARNVAFERRPSGLRSEQVENEPVEEGDCAEADEDLLGRLEPQGQEAAEDVAHRNALQHAEDAHVLQPVHPVLAEGPAGVVRGGGVEREHIEAQTHQENEDAALDEFPGALPVEGVAVFGEGEGHRHADAEKEKGEHQIGRRTAGPGCVFERRKDVAPASGVVDQDHPGHGHPPQDVEGDISLGFGLRHNPTKVQKNVSFRA